MPGLGLSSGRGRGAGHTGGGYTGPDGVQSAGQRGKLDRVQPARRVNICFSACTGSKTALNISDGKIYVGRGKTQNRHVITRINGIYVLRCIVRGYCNAVFAAFPHVLPLSSLADVIIYAEGVQGRQSAVKGQKNNRGFAPGIKSCCF